MSETVLVALLGIAGTLLASMVAPIVENKRAKNERESYIQRVRFDYEFTLYQALVETHLTMVYDAGAAVMLTRGAPYPGINSTEEFITIAAKHIDDADIQNKRSAPFISKEIFEAYKELGKLSFKALNMFNFWHMFDENSLDKINYNGKPYTRDEAKNELVFLQKEVSALSDSVLEQVREYMAKTTRN